MIKKRKALSIFITMAVILTMVFSSVLAVNAASLSDIEGHWAQDTIRDMVGKGIITGYPDGSFKPNNNITRAEFTSLLVRAFNLESGPGKTFGDTAGHWAGEIIKTANYHGLVSGYSDTLFGPDDPVTREQIAAMVINAIKIESFNGGGEFTDSAQVSDWAKESVAKAAIAELITGYPDGTFKPKANATRAEAAVVLDRTIKFTDVKVTLEISPMEAKVGDEITLSGNAGPDTFISIKVVDGKGEVVYFDAVKSDKDGAYDTKFIVPGNIEGDLTIVTGYGANVATETLKVIDS